MQRLKTWLVTACVISAVTVGLFIVANLACLAVFYYFPGALKTEAERVVDDFNWRFASRQGEQTMKWLAIDDPQQLQAFSVENTTQGIHSGHIYEDFTHFRIKPWKGKFFNFADAGYREVRNQGPWPPSPQFFNVFFFGGSTTVGVGPDWATISSYVQEHFEGYLMEGKPVRVYNFGRGSYFSTQERILFQQLLLNKHVPNLVVFVDGLNDFFHVDGRPSGSGAFEQAFNQYSRPLDPFHDTKPDTEPADPLHDRITQSILDGSFVDRSLGRLKQSVNRLQQSIDRLKRSIAYRAQLLPLGRAAAIIGDRLFPSTNVDLPIYKPEVMSRDQLEQVISRYLENKRQIEAVSKAYGIRSLFVWQPAPGYKYDLTYHISLNPMYGLGGHERSSQGYPLMAERRQALEQGENFLWLADMQENRKEPLYTDAVHYTADFLSAIAKQIVDFLKQHEEVASLKK